jgi:hypothetical protein
MAVCRLAVRCLDPLLDMDLGEGEEEGKGARQTEQYPGRGAVAVADIFGFFSLVELSRV